MFCLSKHKSFLKYLYEIHFWQKRIICALPNITFELGSTPTDNMLNGASIVALQRLQTFLLYVILLLDHVNDPTLKALHQKNAARDKVLFCLKIISFRS